jgi:phospholipid transport system substrate-binding protein
VGTPKIRAGAIALSLVVLLACASDEPPPVPTDPDFIAARAVIERLDAVSIEVAKNADELGFQGRFDSLLPVVREIFDVRAMARGTIAPHWDSLTPEQQEAWVELFTKFHTSAVAHEHRSYSGQFFSILGERRDERGLVIVSIRLEYPGRDVNLRTDYRLRSSPRGWLIVDVHQPPSVSEVAMRRAEYAAVYERGGFEKIVERMQQAIARWAERAR